MPCCSEVIINWQWHLCYLGQPNCTTHKSCVETMLWVMRESSVLAAIALFALFAGRNSGLAIFWPCWEWWVVHKFCIVFMLATSKVLVALFIAVFGFLCLPQWSSGYGVRMLNWRLCDWILASAAAFPVEAKMLKSRVHRFRHTLKTFGGRNFRSPLLWLLS